MPKHSRARSRTVLLAFENREALVGADVPEHVHAAAVIALQHDQLKLRNELRDLVTQFSRLHGKAVANPADADLRYQLGVVANRLDKRELARSWFMAALALDPTHTHARQALQDTAAPRRPETRGGKPG
jgi:hypothetical protein